MTKEEIRNECIDKKWPLGSVRNKMAKLSSWGIEYEMMDQYAKQQIMAYEIWVTAELMNDSSFNYGKTPEQLYDLFFDYIKNKQS